MTNFGRYLCNKCKSYITLYGSRNCPDCPDCNEVSVRVSIEHLYKIGNSSFKYITNSKNWIKIFT